MARGRMVNNSISRSLKFDKLPDDTCRLLATWIISHLDKNGVFYGDPVMVRSLVFPRRSDVPIERVEHYLQEMEKIGLIALFEVDGETWQCWPGFADNQIGLRADRETTDFPEPPQDSGGDDDQDEPQPDGDLPDDSRKAAGDVPEDIPPKVKVKEKDNLNTTTTTRARGKPDISEKTKAPRPQPADPILDEIGELCRRHHKDPAADEKFKGDLLATCQEYGAGEVLEAIRLAHSPDRANGRPKTWGYVKGILNSKRNETRNGGRRETTGGSSGKNRNHQPGRRTGHDLEREPTFNPYTGEIVPAGV